MSPKISSSPFGTFSKKTVDFSWRCLLIVLRTAEPSCWVVSFFFFCFFSLPKRRTWDHIGPACIFCLSFLWGWSYLDSYFFWQITLMHSTVQLTFYLYHHQKSQTFNFFSSSSSLLLSMLSSSFFKLLFVPFLSFKKRFFKIDVELIFWCYLKFWMKARPASDLLGLFTSFLFLLYFLFRFVKQFFDSPKICFIRITVYIRTNDMEQQRVLQHSRI